MFRHRSHDGVHLRGDGKLALVLGELDEFGQRASLSEIFVVREHASVLVDRRGG